MEFGQVARYTEFGANDAHWLLVPFSGLIFLLTWSYLPARGFSFLAEDVAR
jgi:hypothetical protein